MGRRKKKARMVPLTVYLPPCEAEKVTKYAEKEDVDISFVLRNELCFGPILGGKILSAHATNQRTESGCNQ